MKADNIWMIQGFIGRQDVLFHIPVYQRNYDWSEQNCNRLLDDVERILQTGEKHFLGSIVFMSSKENSFSMPKYIIIHGDNVSDMFCEQQRSFNTEDPEYCQEANCHNTRIRCNCLCFIVNPICDDYHSPRPCPGGI